jgi:hypothetical protein
MGDASSPCASCASGELPTLILIIASSPPGNTARLLFCGVGLLLLELLHGVSQSVDRS